MRPGLFAEQLLLGLCAATAAAAVPVLNAPRELGPVVVFPDDKKSGLYYFAPGDIELAREPSGRPDLHFLQMRYSGSTTTGDEGDVSVSSTLTLHMRMNGPSIAELNATRRLVRKLAGKARVELRPLPISRFEAALVYSPIGRNQPASGKGRPLASGHFEADEASETRSKKNAYWTERTYSVQLDERTSQVLWKTLQDGNVLMSIGYAFFSTGLTGEGETDLNLSLQAEIETDEGGLPDVFDALREELAAKAQLPGERMVKAGASGIRVDSKRWPDLLERIDFAEKAPPGYARLKVYCYDFKDGLRPDLFYKKVEIEAIAVGGKRVPLVAKFLNSAPDLYARTVRFPVAVRIDKPFRYRVVTATKDGTVNATSWQERQEWAPILDITSRPKPPAEHSEQETDG